MIKVVLVCMFFVFNESPVTFEEGSTVEVETYIVEKEMKSMEECKAAKHQLELMSPPPPAFAVGYYCEVRNEQDI